jgi:cysteinyl-tRNA synthetase
MNSLSAPYLKAAMQLIGLPDAEEVEWFRYVKSGDLSIGTNSVAASRIDALLERRSAAKAAGNYAEADRIRDGLVRAGIKIKDLPGGPVWDFEVGEVNLSLLEALE